MTTIHHHAVQLEQLTDVLRAVAPAVIEVVDTIDKQMSGDDVVVVIAGGELSMVKVGRRCDATIDSLEGYVPPMVLEVMRRQAAGIGQTWLAILSPSCGRSVVVRVEFAMLRDLCAAREVGFAGKVNAKGGAA